MLKRLFHIAINSKDLDRSVAFYQDLGFEIVQDRAFTNELLPEAFAVPSAQLRFVHLRLGQDPDATILDIVQWHAPDTADGPGVLAQNVQGLTRFSVLTDDTVRVYEALKAKGAEFVTEPHTVMTPDGGWTVCLVLDPDGVVVQITELVPAP